MSETTEKPRHRVQAGRGGGPKETGTAVAVATASAPMTIEPAPTNMLAVIARAAADPRVDVAKMQALLGMQKEIEDRDAQKAFTVAFIAMQKKIPSIQRDGKIEIREKDQQGGRTGRVQQSTPYATFNGIMKAVDKPLRDHGFSLTFATEPATDGRIIVRGILEHEQGHSRTTSFPLPAETSGSKNNVQGWGSAMSYGKRYCTIALLNIISHDPKDADTDGHEGTFKAAKEGSLIEATDMVLISPAQIEELKLVIQSCGVSEEQFLQRYKIDKLSELPADMLEAAKTALRRHKEERGTRG